MRGSPFDAASTARLAAAVLLCAAAAQAVADEGWTRPAPTAPEPPRVRAPEGRATFQHDWMLDDQWQVVLQAGADDKRPDVRPDDSIERAFVEFRPAGGWQLRLGRDDGDLGTRGARLQGATLSRPVGPLLLKGSYGDLATDGTRYAALDARMNAGPLTLQGAWTRRGTGAERSRAAFASAGWTQGGATLYGVLGDVPGVGLRWALSPQLRYELQVERPTATDAPQASTTIRYTY